MNTKHASTCSRHAGKQKAREVDLTTNAEMHVGNMIAVYEVQPFSFTSGSGSVC